MSKLNSIGLAVEPGAYVNLWGYFYYQLKNISGVQTTQSLGALYVESVSIWRAESAPNWVMECSRAACELVEKSGHCIR